MFLGFKLVLLYPQWNPGYDTISMKYYTFTHTYTYMYGAGELFMIKYEKKTKLYMYCDYNDIHSLTKIFKNSRKTKLVL